jgi:hypothetical protein
MDLVDFVEAWWLSVQPLFEAAGVAGRFERTKALRKVGSVFQGFELHLGARIVIRDVRAAVGLGLPQFFGGISLWRNLNRSSAFWPS